jgi:hypothetical protein
MKLIPQHHTPLAILGFVAIASLLCYWLLVAPIRSANEENAVKADEREKRLLRTGFPLDPDLLEKEVDRLNSQLKGANGAPGVMAGSQAVMETATRMFSERVEQRYGSLATFRRDADRIFFQSDFSRISLKLSGNGIPLAPTVLGISDESPSPYIYQLILQIWTVERAADLVTDAGLTVLPVPDVQVEYDGKQTNAADIRLRPLRAFANERVERRGNRRETIITPYLLEIPVQVSVRGTLDQVRLLIRNLTANGNFLPATHVEIQADDPSLEVYHDGRKVTVDKVRATIECSAFFRFGPVSEATGSAPAPAARK